MSLQKNKKTTTEIKTQSVSMFGKKGQPKTLGSQQTKNKSQETRSNLEFVMRRLIKCMYIMCVRPFVHSKWLSLNMAKFKYSNGSRIL